MSEPAVFIPSGEFQAQRSNDRNAAQDRFLAEHHAATSQKRAFSTDDLPEEVNGARVLPPDEIEQPTVKSFTRAQLRQPGFYAKHREEILEAQRLGLVIDDVTPRPVVEAQVAPPESNLLMTMPFAIKQAQTEADKLYDSYKRCQSEAQEYLKMHGAYGNDNVLRAFSGAEFEAKKVWEQSTAKILEMKNELKELRTKYYR